MKVFFDMEFTGLHQKTTPISIGCISENDKTFYAEFNDYDREQINPWLRANVMKNLMFDESFQIRCHLGNMEVKNNVLHIKPNLAAWLNQFGEEVEMWSDCLAYDWVLFCEIFGGAFNIPDCIYYIPFDICTLFKANGVDPDINREKYVNMQDGAQKHNALWDAKVIKACYEKLAIDDNKEILF
jgi:hypothetical protein